MSGGPAGFFVSRLTVESVQIARRSMEISEIIRFQVQFQVRVRYL